MKRLAILIALGAILAVPFALRPAKRSTAAAQDTVVIVTPHNEAIRHEYELGFQAWYLARTGRTVAVDWRVLGGTSEIARHLNGAYAGSFQNLWTNSLGRPWSQTVQEAFQNGHLAADAAPEAREARRAFLASSASSGIDVYFGGDGPDMEDHADAGHLWDSGLLRRRPEWFTDQVIPQHWGGELFWRADGFWFGSVVSSYGILYNRDELSRLGLPEPKQWDDLADARYAGTLALCDPTKSGSMATAFENMLQQKMQARAGGLPEAMAVRAGWNDGLRLIQRLGANARYFTDTSQKPPIDVADGNCAAGVCIDFYGNQQIEAVLRRGDARRLGFESPAGGTAYSIDPIALLRGAPHREAGSLFIEYALSLDGQKLWDFRPGTPGGPQEFALRRAPIRRDFYARADWKAYRSDPDFTPYGPGDRLIYRAERTGPVFRELAFVVRVMCLDTHAELAEAWRAIQAAPADRRAAALAKLQDVSFVSYDAARGPIAAALDSADRVAEVRLAKDLADRFRANYRAAISCSRGR
ncbi:MAG TPA: ABC transporter substrate-binding protein [Opitutaceae bacterium]